MSVKNGHYGQVANVLWIVLILNWLVAGAKIAAGIFYDSASMTADGFHSLSDGMSNIIGLIGIRFCLPTKDDCHPYGHKKYETLFSLGIAAMLIMVAINLGKQGIAGILHPVTPQVDLISFVVMIITIVVNISVMIYEYRKGKQMKSDILLVDSMHTRADIFTSFSVIIALIGVKIGFPIVDPIVTFVIGVFIAYSAFEIIREQSRILCDAAAITDLDKIKNVVLSIDGVKDCHKFRSRGRLDDVFLDLHVQMDANVSLGSAHEISHNIQQKINQNFPNIVDVMVHMEPVIEENQK